MDCYIPAQTLLAQMGQPVTVYNNLTEMVQL